MIPTPPIYLSHQPRLRSTQCAPRGCTECIRRKITCTKAIPWQACIRRGEASTCTRETVIVRGTITTYASGTIAVLTGQPLIHVRSPILADRPSIDQLLEEKQAVAFRTVPCQTASTAGALEACPWLYCYELDPELRTATVQGSIYHIDLDHRCRPVTLHTCLLDSAVK